MYSYLTSTNRENVEIVKLPEFTKIFSGVYLGDDRVLLAGTGQNGGEVGILFLSNMSFQSIDLGSYFKGGSVLSVGYNGSSIMLGGYSYHGTLDTCLVTLQDGKVMNQSSLVRNLSSYGEVEGVTWYKGSWIVGGSMLMKLETGEGVSLPLLLEMLGNGTVDNLCPKLPPYFTPQEGGLVINVNGVISSPEGVGVVGDNVQNASFTVFDGSSFQNYSVKGYDQGFFFSASFTPYGWLVGGALSFPSHFSTYMIDFSNSSITNVTLPYHVGLVDSILYNGEIFASLIIPFYPTSGSSTLVNGTVILEGSSPSSLHQVFIKEGVIVYYLLQAKGETLGVGYIEKGGEDEGTLFIVK
ncbi:hypothetical protein [Sulfuracidifex tepidarius]|uniref:hypothetical protein n=1 Tax=Sulfuracidifex tepidarius TaxID=1294262 RepID=UPI0006D216BD|nr:hypothetical protein [Sulfuracidifex tepidarius]